MADNLKQLRARIDALDLEILKLISERATAAHAIGKLKDDGTVYRPEREAQVLRRLSEANPGPVPDKVIMHLFTEVISACRALEDAFSVASLGPRGTFSEEAVIKHFGGQVPVMMYTSIDEVFRSVESGNAGYGVVPMENSTEGAIGRTLDLLLSTPLRICGEILLPVHQNLLSNGIDIAEIKIIYSHAQSLAQCNRWLAQNCPAAERVPVASNAEAARMAQAHAGCAAIAGRAAAGHYGLSIVADNIEDEPNNTTRFVVISGQDVPPSGQDNRYHSGGEADLLACHMGFFGGLHRVLHDQPDHHQHPALHHSNGPADPDHRAAAARACRAAGIGFRLRAAAGLADGSARGRVAGDHGSFLSIFRAVPGFPRPGSPGVRPGERLQPRLESIPPRCTPVRRTKETRSPAVGCVRIFRPGCVRSPGRDLELPEACGFGRGPVGRGVGGHDSRRP